MLQSFEVCVAAGFKEAALDFRARTPLSVVSKISLLIKIQ